MRPDGNGFQTLYSFSAQSNSGGNDDGMHPNAALIPGGDGYLYGTATGGGAFSYGTAFKIMSDGSGFRTLHHFGTPDGSGHTDGITPNSSLTDGGDGYLYGTTYLGGVNGGGILYKLRRDGSGFQTVYSFGATDSSGVSINGRNPDGVIALGDGFLYGTTQNGGANGDGITFKIKTDGSAFQILQIFGTTDAAGNSDGTYPVGGLALGPGGALYGAASAGGPNNQGVLFKMQPDGSGFTVIHNFGVTYSGKNSDGANPSSLTVGPDGLLYGAAVAGGANAEGTVYRLASDGSGFQTLHSFGQEFAGFDGSGPGGPPIIGPDGFLYGTAYNGGPSGQGIVYRIAPVHTHLLWDNSDGRAIVWSIDTNGSVTYSPVYGPFAGWKATGLSTGPDGLSHLLWIKTDGTAALWDLGASGNPTSHAYGPFSGWSAQAITTGSDNLNRMLWNDASPFFGQSGNGPLSLWTVASSGSFTYNFYGPYSGWSGQALASSSGGFTHILWDNANGAATLWSVETSGSTAVSPVYGPYSNWQAISLATGLGGVRDLLWAHSGDGQAALWQVNPDGTYTPTLYGPFSGYQAMGVAAGPDGVAHLLWNGTNGVESLWSVNGDGTYTHTEYGPFSGWTATAVSAGP